MQSIDRAMQIVNILMKSPEEKLSISDLSKESGLPISTMHRLLKAMMKHRLIEQEPSTKLYGLGSSWLEYGLQMYDTIDYVSQIRPELENLMKQIDQSVYLFKPSGDESLIIERIDSNNRAIRVIDNIGLRVPIYFGAPNLAMLSYMSEEKKQHVTKTFIPKEKQEDYLKKLKVIKNQGFAISDSDYTENTRSIAAPIVDYLLEVQGAISITVVNIELSDEKTNELALRVYETAKRISQKMGNQSFKV